MKRDDKKCIAQLKETSLTKVLCKLGKNKQDKTSDQWNTYNKKQHKIKHRKFHVIVFYVKFADGKKKKKKTTKLQPTMQRGDYISKDGGILVTADVVNLCTLLFGASYRPCLAQIRPFFVSVPWVLTVV